MLPVAPAAAGHFQQDEALLPVTAEKVLESPAVRALPAVKVAQEVLPAARAELVTVVLVVLEAVTVAVEAMVAATANKKGVTNGTGNTGT